MKSKLRVAWENQRAAPKREQEDAVNTPVRHNFACGCLVIRFDDANRAGLAWCPQHDRAYQEIGNILPQLLESGENIENIYQLDGMAKLKLRSEEMDGLTIGRMVHYVAYGTPGGEYAAGAHRAAIVAEVLMPENGLCKLLVVNPTGIHFNDASYSATPTPGTWHWIEKA